MSQLGTRLLFYEVPTFQPTEDELLAYAASDVAGDAERVCQEAFNGFLEAFFRAHPVESVDQGDVSIPAPRLASLVRWARFLIAARAEIRSEREGTNWGPVAAMPPEGPFKEIGRAHV